MEQLAETSRRDASKSHADDSMSIHWTLNMRRKCYRFFGPAAAASREKRPSSTSDKYLSGFESEARPVESTSSASLKGAHQNDAIRLQVPLEQQDNASMQDPHRLWPLASSHQQTTALSSNEPLIEAGQLNSSRQQPPVERALSERSGSGSMLSASSSLLSQLLNSSLNQLIEIDTGSSGGEQVVVDTRDLLFRRSLGAAAASPSSTGASSPARPPRRALRRCWLTRDGSSSSSSAASSGGDNRAPPGVPRVQLHGQPARPGTPLIDNQLAQQQPQQQHDSLLEVSQHRPAAPGNPEQQLAVSLSGGAECCDFQCCPLCVAYQDGQQSATACQTAERQPVAGSTGCPPAVPCHRSAPSSSHTFSSSSSCESLGSASSCAVRVTATDSSDSDLNKRNKRNRGPNGSQIEEEPRSTTGTEEAHEGKFCEFQLHRKLVAPCLSGRQVVLASLSGDTAPLFGLDPRQLRPAAASHEHEPQGQVAHVAGGTEDQASVVEARAKLARVIEWSRSGSPMSGVSLGAGLSRANQQLIGRAAELVEPIYDVPTQEALAAAAGRASLSPDQKYPAASISQAAHAGQSQLASAAATSLADTSNKWLPMRASLAEPESAWRPTPSRHQVRLVERSQVRRSRTAAAAAAQQVGARQPRATLVPAAAAAESGGSLSRLATQGSSEAERLQVGAESEPESVASSGCCAICCSPPLNPSRRRVYTRGRDRRPDIIRATPTSTSCRRTCCSCCSCFSSTTTYSSYQHNQDHDDGDHYEPSSLTREYLRRHRSKQHSSHSRHARTHRRPRRHSSRAPRLITVAGHSSQPATCWSRLRARRHGHSHSHHGCSHRRRHMKRFRGHLASGPSVEPPVQPLINGRHADTRRLHRHSDAEPLSRGGPASGQVELLLHTGHSQKHHHRQKAAHHRRRRPTSPAEQQQARLMDGQSVPAGDLESALVGARNATATLARSPNYESSPAPQVSSPAPEAGLHLPHRGRSDTLAPAQPLGGPGGGSLEAAAAPEATNANYLRHAATRRYPRLRPAWINGSQGGSRGGGHRRRHRHHLLGACYGPHRAARHAHCSADFTCHDSCLRGRHSCAASGRPGRRLRRPSHSSSGGAGKLSAHRKLEQRAIEQLESAAGRSPAVRFHRPSDAQQFGHHTNQHNRRHHHHLQHQQQAAAYLVRAQRILNKERRRRRKRSNLLKSYPLAGFGGCFGRQASSGSSVSLKSGYSSAATDEMNRATTNYSAHNNPRQPGAGAQVRADKFQSRATLNLMRSMQRALIASSNYTSGQDRRPDSRRQLKSNLTQNTTNLTPQIDRRLMDKFLVKTLATPDQRKISSNNNNKRCQCNHCSLVELLIRQDLETKIRKRIHARKLAGKQYHNHRHHHKLPLKRY